MKNVLLTGGSGFIGTNVKEYYKESTTFRIIAPTSKELNCIEECEVVDFLKNNHIDIVLNFAVYGDGIDRSKDGTKILENNLKMYFNFANHNDLYESMYYLGSGAEFDKRYPICSVHENEVGRTLPVDQYGLMKYIVGRNIETKENIYNLRLFGIFGPNEFWPIKFISNICCKSLKGLPLSIRQNVYFDYLWIDDFLQMLNLILNKRKLANHTYNVVSGSRIDLLSLCHMVNECANAKSRIIVCKDGLGNEYTASNERFMQEFPQFRYTSIENAVAKLYMWYKERENGIDIAKLIY